MQRYAEEDETNIPKRILKTEEFILFKHARFDVTNKPPTKVRTGSKGETKSTGLGSLLCTVKQRASMSLTKVYKLLLPSEGLKNWLHVRIEPKIVQRNKALLAYLTAANAAQKSARGTFSQ